MSMALTLLALAADEIVATNPKLAIRIALRICRYDRDTTLRRVLSRSQLARLPQEAVEDLAKICIGLIEYALPRLFIFEATTGGISWIERMRVALESLSRLVLRLPRDMVNDVLDIGIECYCTKGFVEHHWLGRPLGKLLDRAWISLSQDQRSSRVFDLLTLPMVGMQDFAGESECADPGQFVSVGDFPTERNSGNDQRYEDVLNVVNRGLGANDNARMRAISRLIPLVVAEQLTNRESSEIAGSLWTDGDPILHAPSAPGACLDWVYLILPETIEGEAERSFRSKWLSVARGNEGRGIDHAANMLAQVGAAVTGLWERDRPFPLGINDEDLISRHIYKIVEMLSSKSVGFNLGIGSAITHVGSLARDIAISEDIAEDLYRRVEFFLGPGSQSKDPLIGPVNDIRIALGFAIVPALVRAFPKRRGRSQFGSAQAWRRKTVVELAALCRRYGHGLERPGLLRFPRFRTI